MEAYTNGEALFYVFIIEHGTMKQLNREVDEYLNDLKEQVQYVFSDKDPISKTFFESARTLTNIVRHMGIVRIAKLCSDEEYDEFLGEGKEGRTIVLIDLRQDYLVLFANATELSVERLIADSKRGDGHLGALLKLYEIITNRVAIFDKVIDLT